jgi:thiol:disulfide interchange protein DsbD
MPLALVNLWLVGCASLFGETQNLNPSARTEVRLLLSASEAKPGSTIMVGVLFTMPKDWHIYWRNGGDAGQSPEITGRLPEGITAGPTQWPVPQKYPFAKVSAAYVYHREVMLMAKLHLAKKMSSRERIIQAKVSWLECNAGCVLGEKMVKAALVIGKKEEASADAVSIRDWQAKLPVANTPEGLIARLVDGGKTGMRILRVELPADDGHSYDFFPYLSVKYDIRAQTKMELKSGRMMLSKQVGKIADAWPTEIDGLLVESSIDKAVKAYEVKFRFQ